jgi:hypothetical protein
MAPREFDRGKGRALLCRTADCLVWRRWSWRPYRFPQLSSNRQDWMVDFLLGRSPSKDPVIVNLGEIIGLRKSWTIDKCRCIDPPEKEGVRACLNHPLAPTCACFRSPKIASSHRRPIPATSTPRSRRGGGPPSALAPRSPPDAKREWPPCTAAPDPR